MEVYFKDLISKEASLEKLVDDLSRVVQGVDDFAKAIGVSLASASRSDVAQRLSRLRSNCERVKVELIAKIRATDKSVRENPYPYIAIALVAGLFVVNKLVPQETRAR